MRNDSSQRKIKVLFFYPNEFLGPEMTVYSQIIRYLDRTRFAPYLVLNSDVEGELGLSEAEGVDIKQWKFGYALRAGLAQALRSGVRLPASVAALVRFIRREGIDIIQCSAAPRVGILGLLLARLSGARLILHYHVIPGRYQGMRGFAERLVARHANHSVAVSRFLADRVQEHSPGMKVDVVVNGVDCERFHPGVNGMEMRREYKIADEEVLILQLARLIQQKRQEDTIRAFSLARQQVSNLRLLLVGWEDPRYNGPFDSYRAELEQIRSDEGLADSLIIAEARPEAAQLVAACDIAVMPSIEDAWNLAVTEAMAGAKPTIGADSGGIREQIVDQVTGFLAPPKSPEALASRIVKLASDREMRERMGRAGRRRAETLFDEAQVAVGFSTIYEAMIDNRGCIGYEVEMRPAVEK
ncbi:MAG: glycosyltransferase family 4 protein [Chloroflexi bacterium]|nr:glycosyltransferase family 4 protein [Chloroflexota bacterium]